MRLSRQLLLCIAPLALVTLSVVFVAAQTPSQAAEKEFKNRQSELMTSARQGDVASVMYQLRKGADANALGWGDGTPLDAAVMGGHLEAVETLLHAGARINPKPGSRSPLMWAAQLGHHAIVSLLIDAGADVNLTDASGGTALMYASSRGDVVIAQALLKAGAAISAENNDGNTALTMAVWGCHEDMVRELLDHGARLGPHDWQRERPPEFSDFPVTQIYSGASVPPDFRSNPEAREYRTRLTAAAKGRPDFAGHYIVAEWGCGSNCQSHMLIDARTGAVFDPFSREATDRGASYQVDSGLFIANPADDGVAYEDDPVSRIGVEYYVLRKGKLSLIYGQACSVVDKRQKCGCPDLQKFAMHPPQK